VTAGRDPGDAESRVARRLAPRPSATTCIGVCVHVIDAGKHVEAGTRVATPDHWLAAAWAPPGLGPSRWPEAVAIGSPTATHALDLLLRQLPADATLFLAGRDDVDAALAAEILLEADRNLEPYQRAGVASFVEAERARTRRAIAERYTDHDAGFERFRARVLGVPSR
jgi:hypothetical protein